MKLNEILKPALILFVITGIVAALLGGANMLTADKIEQNNLDKEKKAISEVMKDADSFEPINDEVAKKLNAEKIYEAKSGGSPAGYCIRLAETGYSGPVTVVAGVSSDLKITGISIISQTETPGLGANATSEKFRNQYIGKGKNIGVVKAGPKDNEIAAISGATITSKAVTKAINRAIEIAGELKGGAAK